MVFVATAPKERVPGLRPGLHLVRPGGRAEALKGDPEIDPADFKQKEACNHGLCPWVRIRKRSWARSDLLDLASAFRRNTEPAAEHLNQTMATDNNEDGA